MFRISLRTRFPICMVATIAIVTLISNSAFAIDSKIQMDGAGFSDACTRADESWVSFCNGYVQAVVDSISKDEKVCLPIGTTRTDLVTVAEKEITASRQLRAMNARDAVLSVLRRHYPCR